MWRVYIEFEMRYGDSKKLKGLLYRALGQCPFVKGESSSCSHASVYSYYPIYLDLYLLAFGPLRKLFTLKELNSLADAMSEKGVRMRTAPEEILQQLEAAEARDVSSGAARWR